MLEPVRPRLLRSKDAASYLGISPRTLWTLRNCGTIPVVHVGGRSVRFDQKDLDGYIDAQKARAPSERQQPPQKDGLLPG